LSACDAVLTTVDAVDRSSKIERESVIKCSTSGKGTVLGKTVAGRKKVGRRKS
jgi:hypothetical protein